jgi:hypothetical protein
MPKITQQQRVEKELAHNEARSGRKRSFREKPKPKPTTHTHDYKRGRWSWKERT